MTKLMPAFIKAQSEIHNARLDSKNPHFKSSYASLESVLDAVKPTLNKYGIAVLQPMVEENDKLFIITKLVHESGESIESKTPVMFDKQTAQAMGSGISYARRYSLAALVCIGADDDDANEATQPSAPKKSQDVKPIQSPGQSTAPKKMESASDFVMTFGKETKGQTLAALGPMKVSNMMAFVKTKADQKFRDSQAAKEFVFWGEQFLKKNSPNELDQVLGENKPASGDVQPSDDWQNETGNW